MYLFTEWRQKCLFFLIKKAAVRLPFEYQAHQHASTSLAWSSCAITDELLKSLVRTQKKWEEPPSHLKVKPTIPEFVRVVNIDIEHSSIVVESKNNSELVIDRPDKWSHIQEIFLSDQLLVNRLWFNKRENENIYGLVGQTIYEKGYKK